MYVYMYTYACCTIVMYMCTCMHVLIPPVPVCYTKPLLCILKQNFSQSRVARPSLSPKISFHMTIHVHV